MSWIINISRDSDTILKIKSERKKSYFLLDRY